MTNKIRKNSNFHKAETHIQGQIDDALNKFNIPEKEIDSFLIYLSARIFAMGAWRGDRGVKMATFHQIVKHCFDHIDKKRDVYLKFILDEDDEKVSQTE